MKNKDYTGRAGASAIATVVIWNPTKPSKVIRFRRHLRVNKEFYLMLAGFIYTVLKDLKLFASQSARRVLFGRFFF